MQAKVVEPLKALAEITSTAMRTTQFDMIADQLKDALKRSTMVCAEPIQQTPIHRFDFDVDFCPRGALESLVRRHEDLLKILYMQTARSQVSEGSISYDSDLQKATEANSFFAGLMKRPHFRQVLASLVYSKTTPSSQMWLATWSRFTSACQNVQKHFEIFTEKTLPFDNSHLETLFHESSTDIVLFRTMQYIFCAATLEQDCQLDYNLEHERPIRLPLLMKQPIGSPSSEGDVFKVKISAGHFGTKDGLNESAKDMAMKELTVSPWIQDEWKWTSLLLQQDLSHKSVMRAQASIRIQSRVFIFYELAAGDLNQFMTKLETKPPQAFEEKRYMFHQIVRVAKALEFLHKSFRSKDESRMSLFHKDIKLENILVTYEDDPETGHRRPVFKITDFGISSVQYDKVSTSQAPSNKSVFSPRRVLVQTRGDPYFPNAAPEARIGDGLVGAASDVWAFGTVLAQYLAWMYGGNEALEDLRTRLLKDYSDMTFFRVIRPPENSGSNGAPQSSKGADEDASLTTDIAREYAVVKEQVLVWFDDRMTGHSQLPNGTGVQKGDQTRIQDTLFAACWKLLRDKVLICDHRHRAQIEDVCEELSRIQQALGVQKGSL